MTFIDWFAGIGGFRRGLELAGHKCIGFCEFNKYAVMSYTAMHLITDEQKAYLESLTMRQRQKEILKEEYRNGEWYADDITRVCPSDIPRADIWCAGFPCQDISIAGKQVGFQGNRSSLFFRLMYLIGQLREEDRPSYIFLENVKNLLSVNGGWDFAKLLLEMDRGGYDAEWQVLNSKDFGVPQNRERVFVIGHLRGRCTSEVFPVEGTSGKNSICQIGQIKAERDNPNQYRVYDPTGLSPCLSGMTGGGDSHASFIDLTIGRGIKLTKKARCLQARYNKGINNHNGETSGVVIPIKEATRGGYTLAHEGDSINLSMPNSKTRRGRVGHGVAQTLDTSCNQGVMVKLENGDDVYAVWSEEHQCYIAIRRLTPRECFRLQGWTDDYFERAAIVNSDIQLYAQAGNGVTVPVIQAIAEKMEDSTNDS